MSVAERLLTHLRRAYSHSTSRPVICAGSALQHRRTREQQAGQPERGLRSLSRLGEQATACMPSLGTHLACGQ